jgi:hypothetical protein
MTSGNAYLPGIELKAAAKVLASAGRDLTINLLASLIAKGAGLG